MDLTRTSADIEWTKWCTLYVTANEEHNVFRIVDISPTATKIYWIEYLRLHLTLLYLRSNQADCLSSMIQGDKKFFPRKHLVLGETPLKYFAQWQSIPPRSRWCRKDKWGRVFLVALRVVATTRRKIQALNTCGIEDLRNTRFNNNHHKIIFVDTKCNPVDRGALEMKKTGMSRFNELPRLLERDDTTWNLNSNFWTVW
jgi:hypothetical protein